MKNHTFVKSMQNLQSNFSIEIFSYLQFQEH